jgi:trans-aconitate methyltransferase
MNSVQEFYNNCGFPGPYSKESLQWLDKNMANPYINFIDRYLPLTNGKVLDAGCGTGLMCNFFAQRYPHNQFTAIDFAKGIKYAAEYAQEHGISNIKFFEQDILDLENSCIYDTVLCQGVLHHIPEYKQALARLHNQVSIDGTLIVGLYHPLGKILKKFVDIDYYGNDILYQDQEHNVYETCYTKQQVISHNAHWQLLDMWPRYPLLHFVLNPLEYSKSGGLTIYAFKKK